jgi:hypothetical protein
LPSTVLAGIFTETVVPVAVAVSLLTKTGGFATKLALYGRTTIELERYPVALPVRLNAPGVSVDPEVMIL